MKEIIPLKKDIVFKTKIAEVTSVNLEHDYSIKDNMITGVVYLSGSYKMTEASVLEEDFVYNIPFSIAISKRIDVSSVKIEIDDFKYQTIKDVMKINVDLLLTCDEVIESPITEETTTLDDDLEEYFKEEPQEDVKDVTSTIIENESPIDIDSNINNMTADIINNNKYYTYKVYIVREGDDYNTICNKYNVTLDDLKNYNDIDNISIGDKIIIPQIDNE